MEKDYSELLEHYHSMFELFDDIHFNSSVTESVYKRHIDVKSSDVISITHSQINDNRVARSYDSDILRIIFIGSTNIYKGFPLLQEVLMELQSEGYNNWQLDVWGSSGTSECENIMYHGFFKSEELSNIFHEDSVLIAPSVWNETFSLITLEALSFGIPAIVSSTVGAKDIVSQYDSSFVFTAKENLKALLKDLLNDKSKLREYNKSLIEMPWHHSIADHCAEIIQFYKK